MSSLLPTKCVKWLATKVGLEGVRGSASDIQTPKDENSFCRLFKALYIRFPVPCTVQGSVSSVGSCIPVLLLLSH
jgi:hypothetical protein